MFHVLSGVELGPGIILKVVQGQIKNNNKNKQTKKTSQLPACLLAYTKWAFFYLWPEQIADSFYLLPVVCIVSVKSACSSNSNSDDRGYSGLAVMRVVPAGSCHLLTGCWVPGLMFRALPTCSRLICIPALSPGCCHFHFSEEEQRNQAAQIWDDGIVMLNLRLVPKLCLLHKVVV